MSFDEFEVIARREIQNFLDGSNTDSQYFQYQLHQVLKLEWTSKPDTSDEALVIFKITMDNDLELVDFSMEVNYTYGEDEDNKYTAGSTDVPHSEEEYFQMSTIQDLGFRWEFYEYLINVFKGLKNER